MEDRRIDAMAESAQRSARRIASDVQDQVGRASERAQDWAQDANKQVKRLTGKPIESWTRDARRYMQQYPLQAVAITVALGFVLGKLLRRG